MARTVQCRRYNEELEGLERAPLPGAKGQDIFDNVSKKAWLEWQGHQTMLINEIHLNLMDPEARKYLMGERVQKRWVDSTGVWRKGQRACNPLSGGYRFLELWRRPKSSPDTGVGTFL